MASHGSTVPAVNAMLTATASLIGAMREAVVMPYSASACAASASFAVSSAATAWRAGERPRELESGQFLKLGVGRGLEQDSLGGGWAACRSCSARSLEYSTVPMASVPATSPANPANNSTLELTPAPANP